MSAPKLFAVLVLAAVLSIASVVAAEPRGEPRGEPAEDPSRERDGDRQEAQRGSRSSDDGSGRDGSRETSSPPDRRERQGGSETDDQRSGDDSGNETKTAEGDHDSEQEDGDATSQQLREGTGRSDERRPPGGEGDTSASRSKGEGTDRGDDGRFEGSPARARSDAERGEDERGPAESPDRGRSDRGPARDEAARAPADSARAVGGTGEQGRDEISEAGAVDPGPTPTRSASSEEGDRVREQAPEPDLAPDEGWTSHPPASASKGEPGPPSLQAPIVAASATPTKARPPAPHDLQRHAQPETGAHTASADGGSVGPPGPKVVLATEGAAEAWVPILVPFLLGAVVSAVVFRRLLSRSRPDARERPSLPPAGAEGIVVLAREASRRGDETEAIEWMRVANRARPANVEVQLSLAELLVDEDEVAEGLEVARGVLGLKPALDEQRYRCARVLAAGGASREAVDQLARLDPAEGMLARAREDAAFDELRDHPLFLDLLGELEWGTSSMPA